MNDVTLIGRISNDLEIKTTGDIKILNFNIAINRAGSDKADFIPCTAFNQVAENMVKYQKKGSLIAVKGSIRQSEYTDKEGNKRMMLNVTANRVKFLETTTKADDIYKAYSKHATKIEDDDVPF